MDSSHGVQTIKRSGSSQPTTPTCLPRYVYATSIIANGRSQPTFSPEPPPPLDQHPAPPPFTSLCKSIHIPCLEEILHEISVSSSSPSTNDISTHLNDVTPAPPTDNNTCYSFSLYPIQPEHFRRHTLHPVSHHSGHSCPCPGRYDTHHPSC